MGLPIRSTERRTFPLGDKLEKQKANTRPACGMYAGQPTRPFSERRDDTVMRKMFETVFGPQHVPCECCDNDDMRATMLCACGTYFCDLCGSHGEAKCQRCIADEVTVENRPHSKERTS